MCLVIVGFQVVSGLPVVVAANRDERYDRASEPPGLLSRAPKVFGGRDMEAGGTWLGVNEYGVIVAITNRRGASPDAKGLPSRGLLCLNALVRGTARQSVEYVFKESRMVGYNPFNLLAVDQQHAWVVNDMCECGIRAVAPGWHVLANTALDDGADVRVERAGRLLAGVGGLKREKVLEALAAICGDHGGVRGVGDDATLCMHGKEAGTRSSSIIALAGGGKVVYRHVEGAPCEGCYDDIHVPWQTG